jgi:CheY-like chemotaxis protein
MSVEKQEQYKDIIYKCSHQLIDTVNDLIEVSKIEVGSLSLFNSVFNVNELLRQVYYKYKDEADKKGIRFKLSIMFTDKDAVLHSDETKLSQIINYLVNNAIKFTKTGEITVGYTLKNQWTEFFVKDTGIGISTEHQSVIFKPFRQAEISRSRNYSGTGLGLSIAQGFVKKMGGQIWVESELNQGSCFYFKLPVVLKEEEPIVVDFCNPEALNYNFEGMTILIAEDDDFNLTFMIEMFIGTNMIIKKAKNGLEAIEMYQENTDIGLVLMDLKMPHMDGFEATKRLKSINKNLYIIAVTAFSLSEEKEYAIACGCDDVISKPVEQMVILKKIDQIRKRQV